MIRGYGLISGGPAAGGERPPPGARRQTMETRAHYVAVGAFVLAMVALAFIAVLWMARSSLTTDYVRFDIYFKGPVTGLRQGAAVEYNGVPGGQGAETKIGPCAKTLLEAQETRDTTAARQT